MSRQLKTMRKKHGERFRGCNSAGLPYNQNGLILAISLGHLYDAITLITHNCWTTDGLQRVKRNQLWLPDLNSKWFPRRMLQETSSWEIQWILTVKHRIASNGQQEKDAKQFTHFIWYHDGLGLSRLPSITMKLLTSDGRCHSVPVLTPSGKWPEPTDSARKRTLAADSELSLHIRSILNRMKLLEPKWPHGNIGNGAQRSLKSSGRWQT